MKSSIRFFSAALAWLLLAASAAAQPDLSRRVGVTVADSGAPGWRFDDVRLVSADGQRRYRVRVALPDSPAPDAGFPVVYLLDGSAALMEVDAALLRELARMPSPPVLAFVGYDSDLRIDAVARAWDYTPRRPDGGQAQTDGSRGARPSGGADAFLDLIERGIKPKVEALISIDRQRQWLWGHSYGGLFALHVLATRPAAFAGYVAADPSLWWGDGLILRELERLPADGFDAADPRRLLLFVGTGSERRRTASPGRGAEANGAPDAPRQDRRTAVSPEAVAGLIERLDGVPGLRAERRTLDGLSHGQTLGASLAPALREIAQRGTAP